MLTEILLLLLVLVVAALMIVDQPRTRGESAHGLADSPAYGDERPATVTSRAAGSGAFSQEPARSVITMPDSGQSWRPGGIGFSAGSDLRPGSGPVQHEGSRSRRPGTDLRSRILVLVGIPVVTAIVATLCIVRIAVLLNGTSMHSQIRSTHDGAVLSVLVTSAVLVVALALGAWATVKAAGSVLHRRQGLRTDVLAVADSRLGESNGGRPAAPVDADSSHDGGDAAGVFDQMRREISRLTANEAALRAKVDAMFVNLSHRSQSLAERQIRLIENLEHGEQDERRLASLEKMSRIASRMYRSSENLLILAGHEPSSGPSQPVTLTYLVQAAVSDIEDSERVSFDVQPDIAVSGPAAGDAVHLLAELIQNAASFSAAGMPVHVTGHTVTTGGVLVEITDHGIGMTDKEMAYANWQLENPPTTTIDAAKWMGLLVVARLAARHGIKVRLNPAESGGLTALVWFPTEILMHQVPAVSPGNATAVQRGQHAEPPATPRLAGSQPPNVAREDAGVVIPPAESPVSTRRLPIFDEMESRWSATQTVHPPSPGGPTIPALPRRLPTSNPGQQLEH